MAYAALEKLPILQTRDDMPPGPGPLGYLRTQADFMRGQIPFVRSMRQEWGSAVSFWLGAHRTYLLSDPALIEEMLVKKPNSFHKDAITHELEDVLGQGLLTSEGAHWRRQRKLAAPALRKRQIEAYADWMVDLTEKSLEQWGEGDAVELHHEMMALTLRIVVKTLFNLDLQERVDHVGRALDTVLEVFHKHTHTMWRFVPQQIPTHLSRRLDRAMAELDTVVYDLIAQRRASGEEGDDLLWRFLVANDDEGNQMDDEQLRDEVITMFLAGHETTALAITYAWYLLSHHPDIARKVFEEVDTVLGDRRATADDVGRLPYLKTVVQETLRMYSPAWIMGREAIEDVHVGGYFVPKGTQLLASQAVMHYDERWFDDPYSFRPDRWADGLEKELPRFAYFPFGGGARICIGNHFAMMEAMLVIATMAQNFDLENVMSGPIEVEPSVTLRPRSPVSMRVHLR